MGKQDTGVLEGRGSGPDGDKNKWIINLQKKKIFGT